MQSGTAAGSPAGIRGSTQSGTPTAFAPQPQSAVAKTVRHAPANGCMKQGWEPTRIPPPETTRPVTGATGRVSRCYRQSSRLVTGAATEAELLPAAETTATTEVAELSELPTEAAVESTAESTLELTTKLATEATAK